jgi:putative transposase
MGYRKTILSVGECYHVFTKSIAGYEIFRNEGEYDRMLAILQFYQSSKKGTKFSWLLNPSLTFYKSALVQSHKRVQMIAYCLMPTHIHLFLRQLAQNGISEYMRFALNSYARHFNEKTKRHGPLWESRFACVRVETNAQALHLTRYIHLNPVSAGLVKQADQWKYSSIHEYLNSLDGQGLCEFKDIISTLPDSYKKFVDDRQNYQQELQWIKKCLFD